MQLIRGWFSNRVTPVEEESDSSGTYSAEYYLSPTGDDDNDGSFDSPFMTLEKLWTVISAGDTAYLRGGTYTITDTIYLEDKSGTADNTIDIFNYPGESPVLDFSSQTYAKQVYGLRLDNLDYVNLKGIRVTGIQPNGAYLMYGMILWNDVHNCVFENMEFDHINGWGSVVGSNCSHIFYNKCDAHHCANVTGGDPWGDADGFECGAPTSGYIYYNNCRAWWNSDDGWDMRGCGGYVEWNGCHAFWNGYEPDTFTIRGNGIGFKLAGNYTPANHNTVLRVCNSCVAVHNAANGIDSQYDYATDYMGMHIYNCTAYNNEYVGIRFEHFIGGGEVLRNNISYGNDSMDSQLDAAVDDQYNSWNDPPDVTVSDADFQDLTESGLDDARSANGDLPQLELLHLASGSDLIGAGVDVGLDFDCDGNAYASVPSLGAYEV